MSRRLQSVISTALTLILFTVLPVCAANQLPSEFELLLSQAGIDLTNLTNQMGMIGVFIAVMTLVKGFVEEASPLYLLASIVSSVVTLAFTLVTLGVGDLTSMGVSTISIDVEGGLNTMILDFRLFIQLAVLSVALQIAHSVLQFMEARKESRIERTQTIPQIEVFDTPSQYEPVIAQA